MIQKSSQEVAPTNITSRSISLYQDKSKQDPYLLCANDIKYGVNIRFLQKTQYFLNGVVKKCMANSDKSRLPILYGLSSKTYNNKEKQSLVFADFDDISKLYSAYSPLQGKSWDVVSLLFDKEFSGGCQFKTPSGNFKIAFLVKNIASSQDAHEWLLKKFGPVLYDCIDTNGSAAFQCFLNTEIYTKLSTWMNNSPIVFSYIRNVVLEHVITKVEKQLKQINNNEIDKEPWKLNKKAHTSCYNKGTIAHKIFQFLASKPEYVLYLSNGEGIGLLQSFLAEVLDTNQLYISKALTKIVGDGNLTIHKEYVWGRLARRYLISGKWKEELESLVVITQTDRNKRALLNRLPKQIQRGCWNYELGRAAFNFNTAKEYIEWASNLQGINEGDRISKLQGWCKKRFGELPDTRLNNIGKEYVQH